MRQTLIFLLLLASTSFSSLAAAFDVGLVPMHEIVTEDNHYYGRNISLHGSKSQVERMRKWLKQIAAVPKGMETLKAIQESGHKLFIFHHQPSIISAGKTSAPVSENLINGIGESVDIYFNFDIPDAGSHFVRDTKRQPIQFTAVQNLYHELAHAKHMMNGTWLYFRSEGQAIAEENEFRAQQAERHGMVHVARVFKSGIPVCPSSMTDLNLNWGQDMICR